MGEEKLNATTHLHGIWRWVYPTFENLNDLYSCDPKEENEGICLEFLHHIKYVNNDTIYCTCLYNLLLIRTRSCILTKHNARISIKNPWKNFLDFKKWIKCTQTSGYNGSCTAYTVCPSEHGTMLFVHKILSTYSQRLSKGRQSYCFKVEKI